MNGVRVDQLCCPTCQQPYGLPLTVHAQAEDFGVDTVAPTIVASPIAKPYYISCPSGHRWTLKTLWRVDNHPFDYVLLGEYIGND